MSAYTSLALSRAKAKELVLRYVFDMNDEQLKRLASMILEETTLYNVYRIVDGTEENDDERV